MASTNPIKVGIIIGSARVVRIAPQVADFTLSILKSQAPVTPQVTFDRIDIAEQPLPAA